jgi:hypothetical protein
MIALRCLVVFSLFVLQAQADQRHIRATPPISLGEYTRQLQTFEKRLQGLSAAPSKAPELIRDLPKEIKVRSSRGDISISTEFMRDALVRFLRSEPKVKPQILSAVATRLASMRAEALEYEKPNRADDVQRSKLEKILSAREFERVHGPTALELLRSRISAWIYRQLQRLSPNIPEVSDLGQIAIWIVIAAASSVLAVWLYRVSRRRFAEAPREILPFLPSDKSWQAWLIESRRRAAQGEWRDAIHFAFWAAVSRLEAEGVWRPDKARTPREYLNAIPAANQAKAPFSSLVSRFEAVWYGNRATSELDFAGCMTELEKLGCA